MVTIKGLDELTREVADLAKKAKDLDGTRNVPVTEILTDEFVRAHTRFNDVQELFSASGFRIQSAEDFKAIPENEWDAFVRSSSDFPTWDAMLGAAVNDWTRQKLGL